MEIYDECESSLDLIRLRVGVIPLTLSLIRLVIARRSFRRAIHHLQRRIWLRTPDFRSTVVDIDSDLMGLINIREGD